MPASKCKSFYQTPYGYSLNIYQDDLQGNHCSAPLQCPGKDEDLAYRYQADLVMIIRYRANSTQSLRSIINNSQPQ